MLAPGPEARGGATHDHAVGAAGVPQLEGGLDVEPAEAAGGIAEAWPVTRAGPPM